MLDLLALRLQPGRQHQLRAKIGRGLVKDEAGAGGGQFDNVAIWIIRIDAFELCHRETEVA